MRAACFQRWAVRYMSRAAAGQSALSHSSSAACSSPWPACSCACPPHYVRQQDLGCMSLLVWLLMIVASSAAASLYGIVVERVVVSSCRALDPQPHFLSCRLHVTCLLLCLLINPHVHEQAL